MSDNVQNIGDRLLGIDIGSVNVKIALCDSDGQVLRTACLPSQGKPMETLSSLLGALSALSGSNGQTMVGVAGSGNVLFPEDTGIEKINEVVAVAAATRRIEPGARTVIDLGGQYSKWVLLGNDDDRDGNAVVSDFATNGLCAAGTGAFMEQQAGRLDLSLEELGKIAAAADKGASIAGRCSVFAKSDMIHLQQKGTPVDQVAYGLCLALVRTFVGTVLNGRRIAPPVLLTGGGACNPGLIRAFGEVLGLDGEALRVPEEPLLATAIGAALLAGGGTPMEPAALKEAIDAYEEEDGCPVIGDPVSLPPFLMPGDGESMRLPEDPTPVEGKVEAYLGMDVGSVSTNLVLLDRDHEVIQGIYLRTRGRPVEVLAEGLDLIRNTFGDRLEIAGVGATGSGRHLAARLVGADVTHNEITAQMVSSSHYIPEVETIFEIGGQDSKYIHVRDGKLADFEMNKICAAGTGSFLEEQAERLGVDIVEQFASLAFEAEQPCDLGTRCTVFMDSELARAQERSAKVEDLCAGLAYSVCRNYIEKLVAGRHVGEHVVFQGGTASNDAVVAAFRQLLGRTVHVHPYNRISGAIGAALLASRAMAERVEPSAFLGFDACNDAEFRSFECKQCENLCQVNRVRIGERVVHFGDTCERFSERDREMAEEVRPFPELFAVRESLLESFIGRETGGDARAEPIGLLRASLNLEFLPFWTEFLRRLGFLPVVSRRSTPKMMEAHSIAVPAEVCLPIKSAAAQARALLASGEVDRVFVPSILECPQREDDQESAACLYNQSLSDMLGAELGDRMVSAQFALQDGVMGMVGPVLSLAKSLDRPVDEVARSFRSALEVQTEFGQARLRAGESALESEFDQGVVVLGKPYNTHDPFLNLNLAALLARLSLPAIPWDMLPLGEVRLDERWKAVPWHFNREQLRALELIRRDGRLFPILVSNYGCGPDAFVVKHMEEMLAGIPRLLLEFDEHRGEAGLLTRLEAFADEIEVHLAGRRPETGAMRVIPGSADIPAGRRFIIPHFAEHARIYEGALRSAGYEAEVLPPPDEGTVRLGEEYASGRECHPYSILAGDFCRLLQRDDLTKADVFFSPSCRTSCLLRQYGDGFRIIADRLGLSLEVWDAATADLRRLIGTQGVARLYEGVLAADILITLASRLRPYVRDNAGLDRLWLQTLDLLVEHMVERRKLDPVLASSASSMLNLPRDGEPGDRPVVGITGDLYTRINPAGNAGLFQRLQDMGCEVWPSPSFAAMTELGAVMNTRNEFEQVKFSGAFSQGLAWAIMSSVRQRLVRALPDDVRDLAVEPTADRFLELAAGYTSPGTNHMVVHAVGKIADFLSRGASGVISAAGINCMVGTAVTAAVPALRANHRHAPVITIAYGGSEGPSNRLLLETFVHQVTGCRKNVS